MQLIDSHAHLTSPQLLDDVDEMFNGETITSIRETIMNTPETKDFNEARRQANLLIPHKYCEICADRWGIMC